MSFAQIQQHNETCKQVNEVYQIKNIKIFYFDIILIYLPSNISLQMTQSCSATLPFCQNSCLKTCKQDSKTGQFCCVESMAWWVWIIIAAGLMLVAGIVVLIVVRIQKKKQASLETGGSSRFQMQSNRAQNQ
ncbi:Hypothetical_protein [Hexamita inflata]|uniref:Hypothetical_protein n=1 Tax=Hexamita inflata TaxID=28002 RepID=A0AA86VEF3_9EUKA|nr:Hypothetical protein HINF_LOCUS51903 [Hexamita inflata]